jgi:hypothetical protein
MKKLSDTYKELGVEPIDPDAATFEVTMTKEEHDIILSLWVDAKTEPPQVKEVIDASE